MVSHEPLVEQPAAPNGRDAAGRDLPKEITVVAGQVMMRPMELRVLKAMTGKSLEQLSTDEVDSQQMNIWLALRHAGYEPSWEDAGQVWGVFVTPGAPDPTNVNISTTSPRSAGSGE